MKLFDRQEITFSDILLLPQKSSFDIDKDSIINTSSKLTKKIIIKTPIVTSNMISVTESDMAIIIAEKGGVGIIHQFMTKERQLDQVLKVKNKNLLVGAAFSDLSKNIFSHIQKLLKIGCDVILLDSAHAYNKQVISIVKILKYKFPRIELIVGNIVTGEAVEELIKAGADAIRVGIGPGSHCTTRIVTGHGRPQISALIECIKSAKNKVPIMADGGIENSGDIIKALAVGASTVMIGGMISGSKQSPGITINHKGNKYKESWGNCTTEALSGSWENNKYSVKRIVKNLIKKLLGFNYQEDSSFEEGIHGLVKYKGDANIIFDKLISGIKRGMWYCGAKNIQNLYKNSKIITISPTVIRENFPRDIIPK